MAKSPRISMRKLYILAHKFISEGVDKTKYLSDLQAKQNALIEYLTYVFKHKNEV